MTAPFMSLAPQGVFPAALPGAGVEPGSFAPGGPDATREQPDFTAALTLALLCLRTGASPTQVSSTTNVAATPASDAESGEEIVENGGNAGATNATATSRPDARATPAPIAPRIETDRSSINAFRSFVERVAGVSAQKPTADVAPEPAKTDKQEEEPRTELEAVSATPSGVSLVDAAADPTLIVRDLSMLHPDMRTRLDRVITRMEQETGHDVSVAETWRSQTRQDYLHEQGRTRAGEIVTWTEHSKHSDGLAVDLVVDDGRGDDAAYGQLRRIASEEGLRTLGARDPGHVELVATRGSAPAANTAAPIASAPKPAPQDTTPRPPAATTTMASVAAVAPVAPVAQVATVATVAQVGMTNAAAAAPEAREDSTPAPRARAKLPARQLPANDTASDNGASRFTAAPRDATATPRAREAAAALTFTPGVETASRAERVHALQDAARTGPMSGLMLRLDSADGTDDRVRIDLRGRQVGARIDVPELARATELTGKLPELQRALEARGFDVADLQVRPIITRGTAGEIFMHAPASNDAITTRSANDAGGAHSDGRSPNDDGAPPRSHQHGHRHRSRRDRGGETQ